MLVTRQSTADIWSYPDLHGNTTRSTDAAGTPQGSPVSYDPWGQRISAASTQNLNGNQQLAAFATAGKLTDTTTGITIMGARPYNPTEARFLTVDPIEGGCANPYTYAYGDPINGGDLTGRSDCSVSGSLAFLAALGSIALGLASALAPEAMPLIVDIGAQVLGAASVMPDAPKCVNGDAAACIAVGMGVAGAALGAKGLYNGADASNVELTTKLGAGAGAGAGVGAVYGAMGASVDVGQGGSSILCGLVHGIIDTVHWLNPMNWF